MARTWRGAGITRQNAEETRSGEGRSRRNKRRYTHLIFRHAPRSPNMHAEAVGRGRGAPPRRGINGENTASGVLWAKCEQEKDFSFEKYGKNGDGTYLGQRATSVHGLATEGKQYAQFSAASMGFCRRYVDKQPQALRGQGEPRETERWPMRDVKPGEADYDILALGHCAAIRAQTKDASAVQRAGFHSAKCSQDGAGYAPTEQHVG
ncbi:hypothetical protein B0H14DRAFT_3547658 [Mycena olivaceomarginata]|nr:hypothetical protein B0H14DRAFT_3547658 [Mycena olivaceomarginata]